MSTTLNLYWNLASPAKNERLDASVKLVGALQSFQQAHVVDIASLEEQEESVPSLDDLNAQDVSYALRRLVRGLASARESSRLGFAVALTELLSRIETVSASQMIDLVMSSSELTGSLNGQEERDMMFARLFGFTSIVQSGLIVRETPLPYTSGAASSLDDYQRLISEIVALGELKSWFRESCWWAILETILCISQSSASYKTSAMEWTLNTLFVQNSEWTPEKVGIWLRFHSTWTSISSAPLKHIFKGRHMLTLGNLPTLAKVLKESELDDEEAPKPGSAGIWKPTTHFVWTVILDQYFPSDEAAPQEDISTFQDFFRIVIDESIFTSTASPERKYIGFQLVEQILKRTPVSVVSHLFTKNFVRTWINQLARQDRYLHKAALKLASAVHKVVQETPSVGFPLVIQLLGPNGSRDFDRLSHTKTVETILGNMSVAQIAEYVQFLFIVFEDATESETKSVAGSDQVWALDQASSLIRSSIVPKDDSWVHLVLEFFIRQGFFQFKAKSKKKGSTAEAPEPIRSACRSKLLVALADLSSQAVTQHQDAKTAKFNGRTTAGEYWAIDVVKSFRKFGKDKELRGIFDQEEEALEARSTAWSVIKALQDLQGERHDAAQASRLLVGSYLLQTYRAATDDADDDAVSALEECVENVTRLFSLNSTEMKGKLTNGTKKMNIDEDGVTKPIDLVVDDLIGCLEKPDAFLRTVAAQVFTSLCSLVESTTIDLLLEQLQPRNLLEDQSMAVDEDEDEEGGEEGSDEDDSGSKTSKKSSSEGSESSSDEATSDEQEEEEGDVDPEFRQKIAEALGDLGAQDASESDSDDSSEILMDDDQMMQLDEKLADVFRSHSLSNKTKTEAGLQREATHFKIRVLDFIDIFVRKCQTSREIPRILLPLIRVVMQASGDEQQLIDKTNGILRKRIDSLQSLPEGADIEQVAADLEDVHNIARKASHQQISPASLTSVSIYLSKILVQDGRVDAVAKAYRESLEDFMNRKGSKIYHTFFADSVKRIPAGIWEIRKELIRACASDRPVNTFRQMQAIHWTDALLNHTLQVVPNKPDECLSTMQLIRETTFDSLRRACDGRHPLTVAQAKNVVKMALQAMRITARVDSTALNQVWDPQQMNAILVEVQASQKLTKGGGLMVLVRQMARRLGIEQQNGTVTKVKKRKAGAEGAKSDKSRKKSKKHAK